MASSISHIVYAGQYLKKNPGIKDKQEFILGVCFPDVRYVSNVARAETHNCFDPLDLDFEEISSFEAGWKFHVWCDLRRDEVLRDLGYFELPRVQDKSYVAGYLLEDFLIWQQYKNWETVNSYLEAAPFRDVFKHLSQSDWDFWYKLLADYTKRQPTKETTNKKLRKIPSFSHKKEMIFQQMESLSKDDEVVEILSKTYLKIV